MNRKKNQIVARWSYAIIFLLSLLFVPALATPTSAAGTATVRLEPAAGNVDVGQTIDVNVVVADVTNLYAVEVHLTYDPNLLEVVDANPAMAGVQVGLGPFLAVDYTPQNQVDQGAGQIDFAYSQMAPSSPASGTGVIATITFRGKAAGTSALSFTSVILADQGAAEPAVGARGIQFPNHRLAEIGVDDQHFRVGCAGAEQREAQSLRFQQRRNFVCPLGMARGYDAECAALNRGDRWQQQFLFAPVRAGWRRHTPPGGWSPHRLSAGRCGPSP